VNFTKICPCFSFTDLTQNVDVNSSKIFRLQQTIEVGVRNPTKTRPQPTGWEPLA